MHKQTAKLVARIAENLPNMTEEVMQGWIDNPKGLQKTLLVLASPAEPILVSEVIDPIIHVDRNVKLVYPDWVMEVLHLELENTGPTEYDGTKLEQYLLPEQKNSAVTGYQVYRYLKDGCLLRTCVGLRDLKEIQKKGIAFFRAKFKNNTLFGWRSVVRHRDGNLDVPCLYEDGGKVVLNWHWLGSYWNAYGPALRFAS